MTASSTAPTADKDMRGALADAALVVLRREGPAGLTVRAVTKEAGCSTTGIYTQIGGKHGLVEEVFLQGFESFDEAVRPGLDAVDLRAPGRAYRRWALERRTQYLVMFASAVPDYVPSEAARRHASASFAQLAASVERVAPGDDAAGRTDHLFATVRGYVMLELAGMNASAGTRADVRFERALRDLVSPRELAHHSAAD